MGRASDEDGVEIELSAAAPEEASSPEAEEMSALTGSLVVVVDGAALQWMEEYARGDTSHERGAILLGRLLQVEGETGVTIEAAVEAVGAEERQASITFTHRTWEHVTTVKETQYPDLRIVGWFHTHPGYSVFLSGYDLFIHRNFFDLPWQVAFVIDPVHNDRGFFGWKGEEIARLPGYVVKGEAAEPVAAEGERAAPQEVLEVRVGRRSPVLAWGAAALVMVLVVGGGVMYWGRGRDARVVNRPVHEQDRRPGARSARPQAQHAPAPPQVKAPSPAAQERGKTPPAQYVEVQAGDTLWEISRRYLGSPRHYPKLQELNGIEDPRRLRAGTVIAVPEGGEEAKSRE